MRFVTYTATPGLERFPESERFRVYRSAYKRLMQQDTDFRRRVLRFRVSIVVASVFLFILTCTPTLMIGHGGLQTAIGIAILVISTLGYVGYVLVASFRVQEFQNEQIGRLLQSHMA